MPGHILLKESVGGRNSGPGQGNMGNALVRSQQKHLVSYVLFLFVIFVEFCTPKPRDNEKHTPSIPADFPGLQFDPHPNDTTGN